MIELKELCPKGHKMDMRMVEVRDDEDNPTSEILLWLLHGVCDKCKKIIMLGIHKEKIAPTEGIDYKFVNKRCEASGRKP